MIDASSLRIQLRDVEEAAERLRGIAWRTSLVPASRHDDGNLYLKLECLQRNGSFKIRGAWNRMSRCSPAEQARGFVTVSAGNHGQAVAWSARRLGAPCTVWVPDTAVERKVHAMEALGATVKKMPHDQIMASMTGDRWTKEPQTYIHPFGDRHVIAGQGTIGLEILEDLPDVRTLLVPVGGGGMVAGIAAVVHARRPEVKVYGVQAANAAPLALSLQSGHPESVPTPKTIADGIGASRVFDYMFPLLREQLAGCLTVTEEELRAAILHLAHESHVVAEAAGAASLAAAWKHQDQLTPPVACIVSGGNIDPALLAQIAGRDPALVASTRT